MAQLKPGGTNDCRSENVTVDQDALLEFIGRFVGDLGATMAAGSVVVGHRLGLYSALAVGPATPEQLAERTGTNPRYVIEWLAGQAAGDYVSYDATTGTFSLSPEQAFALADPDGLNVPAAFLMATGALRAEPRITEAFRTGAGFGWHEHDPDVFTGCEAFFRPLYIANLVSNWIPALDDVEAKLAAGGRVADVGCGHGASSVLLAEAYPRTTIVGSDYHRESIDVSRRRADDAGVADQISFEVELCADLHRIRLRPGGHVRLPARHGRPARSGSAHPRCARRRRNLAHRRALRRRRRVRQPQSDRTHVLLVLELPLRTERTVPSRRLLARSSSR